MRSEVRRGLRYVVRLCICVLAAGLVAAPLAIEHALENTQVQSAIGVVPATFTLTGNSETQLRLGVLGNLYSPSSKRGFGISATVDGPPPIASGDAGIGSYFSPQMLEIYGGLFHDPSNAVRGYTDALTDELRTQVVVRELGYAAAGGALLFVVSLLLDPAITRRLSDHAVAAAALILSVALASTVALAYAGYSRWRADEAAPDSVYALPSLDGTFAAGTVTDSAVLRLAIEGAIPEVEKLIVRQETRTRDYVTSASASLMTQRPLMDRPREGEVAIMMQSDMHCNAAMIDLQGQVVATLNKTYGPGTVSLLAITGDLTTNGTAAEAGCIEDEAAIAAGAPIAAVIGNHETELSAEQMTKAGMDVLDGETVELAGTTVLGAGDPSRTEMFGATTFRGEATERSVGADMYAVATDETPELVLLHEAYAVETFIGSGVRDMRRFLDGRGSTTEHWDDGIRDLPAGAVFYGHWHRVADPRVVWNSDGSWTLVMELNTSGGAVAAPTFNHFSTPWSKPQRTASFPVVFKNIDSGLVTGYQIYSFATDGTVTVEPRVDIGTPDGQPHR